jgi:serine protease Do
MDMKTKLFGWRSAVAAGALAVACIALIAATPNSGPKLNLSDKEIDRTARGASYAAVIKRVTPSVVTIQSTRTIRRNYGNPFFDDPMFRQFFGDRMPRGGPQRQQGLGSGVIVSEDGYILTNNHVVEGADEDGVKVALSDGKTKYDAKVVGRDPHTDVAVLKIEAKKLTAITIADSDKLEVGDVVLAIGNPFGVGQSVTMGIVSATGRGVGILGQGGYEDFIQTDAAINPGNSGGALVDTEGRLVGINQSIASPSGGNSGVGFAVPANLARSVMNRLATDGKITRGYLGVGPQEVTPDLAKDFNLPDNTGALVGEVRPGTAAEKAGIREGDVIIEVNGRKVTDPRHLSLMVSQMAPKTKVTVKALRDGKEKVFNVTLGTHPDDVSSRSNDDSNSSRVDSKNEQLDGVEVGDLDNRIRRQLDIPERINGAVVTKVDPESKAAEAGLREGDIILEINREPVKDAEAAVRLSEKAAGDRVLLRVYTQENGQGGTRYLHVRAGKNK